MGNGNPMGNGNVPWDGTAHIYISYETQKENEIVRMLLNCHTSTILLNFKVNKFCYFLCLFVHVVLFSRY